MADELPENIDLNWIGRTLVNLQRDMRDGFAELRGDIAELKQMRAEDRSLLEDVAREAGIEPTPKRLRREQFEKETSERLDKIEAKLFPPAE
jgi:hypothetical protein